MVALSSIAFSDAVPVCVTLKSDRGSSIGSPTYSRPSTTKLAKLTKAKVASIAYRLAPQNPFPAALLDFLTAWLSLLYPAKDARHTAVSPDSVVFAGDSAGGNLCLSMVQAILRIRSMEGHNAVIFNGKSVQVPLPAGVAVLSPFADLSLNLPSWSRNAHIDYLHDLTPVLKPDQLSDDVWPTQPPRGDPYCHPSAWLHPLVCPAVADDWKGSPPLWLAVGEERCADGAKVIATQAARHNVPVAFSEYLGMPHIFPMLLGKLPQSQQCFQEWANACLAFWRKASLSSNGTIIHMPGDKRQPMDVDRMSTLTLDEVKHLIADGATQRQPWTGSSAKL